MSRRSRFAFLLLLLSSLVLSPAHAETAPKSAGVNLYLMGAGVALLSAGGAFAYVQNREADRDMRIYRRSAFTDRTEDHREKVETHQRLTWGGLAGAALGGILFVVSF